MENSNKPVQRVTPIRSEYPNRLESNLNIQSSSSLSDFSLCNQNNLISNVNVQQFKINNNQSSTISNQSSNILDSLPFLQQNVNIMNINLPNNTILQNVPQDSVSIQNTNFNQPLSNQKTLIQLSDGRIVQFAQNLQPSTQSMPTTILVQMPYKVFDQNLQKSNQNSINKKFLLPSKSTEKSPQNMKSISMGSGNVLNMNTDLLLNTPIIDQSQQQLINDYQRNIKDQINNLNFDHKLSHQNHSMTADKYQEICDILHNKKLLTKLNSTEETVLVEFRLNQQKYQLRMTRNQKVEMEKILVSMGNQQRQMEILQVYQAEQRKMMQQRTPVVLNQMVNKTATPNIVCNKPQIQGLNIAKQVYPINSVLVALPQSQYGDSNFIQSPNQSKNVSIQPTASQSSNGILLAARLPISQQSAILSSPPVARDSNKDTLNRQKRNVKTPNTTAPITSSYRDFLPNANANNEMKPARSRRYNNMRKVLLDDHNAVLMPNCSKPFTDLNDAVQRLLPYHILEESKDQRTSEVDRILHQAFNDLNKKCANLKRISSALSMHNILCDNNPENLIVKRMRLDLERDVFEHEKLLYVNSDENLRVVPLQFDEEGNALPISIDLSTSPVTIFEEDTCAPENTDTKLSETLFSTSATSFVESMEDNNVLVDSSDNLPDSLCNYDIQDISIDSIDSPVSECDWNNQDKDSLSGENVGNPQSEDPDLDAAIKSILF